MEDPHLCALAWVELTAAHRAVNEMLTAALASRCGLTFSAFEALLALDKVGAKGARPRDLNDDVPLSQPALSRLVARLENEGLVARAGDSDDGRSVRLALTKQGRRRLRRATAIHADLVRTQFTDRLDETEQRILTAALARIRTACAEPERRGTA